MVKQFISNHICTNWGKKNSERRTYPATLLHGSPKKQSRGHDKPGIKSFPNL